MTRSSTGRRFFRFASLYLVLAVTLSACQRLPFDLFGDGGLDDIVEEVADPFAGDADTDGTDPADDAREDPPATEEPSDADGDPRDTTSDDQVGCVYEGIPDGDPMGEDEYLTRTGDINYELEILVMDMDAELVELEEGMHDWRSLLTEFEEFQIRFSEVTAGATGIVPPPGAESWHDQLMMSWVGVCDAIENGIAGTRDGDDAAFEAFVDAMREFPTLYNELHANMMVGPFEDG